MQCLHSLANTDCFGVLQNKLYEWGTEFEHNCTESNIGKCCEILELNAQVQAQLFKLLGLCAIQGNFKGTKTQIKNRILPYLGERYLSHGLTANTVIEILNDVSTKVDKFSSKSLKKSKLRQRSCSQERRRSRERKLSDSEVRDYGMKTYSRSNGECISQNLDKLRDMVIEMAVGENSNSKSGSNNKHPTSSNSTFFDDFTREESKRRDDHGGGDTDDIDEIRQDTYLKSVVGEYNDLFSESRVNSMDILRQHVDDHENNQRILFALVMTTSKKVAEVQRSLRRPCGFQNSNAQKLEFRNPISHSVIKSLEVRIVRDMRKNRGSYSRFYLPTNLNDMEDFIDRTIELLWKFGGVSHGLQLLEAVDAELFDEHKYRRSYDSDFNAPLVNHHIWPCLMQGRIVLVKGEACTRASSKLVCNRKICATNNPKVTKPSSK